MTEKTPLDLLREVLQHAYKTGPSWDLEHADIPHHLVKRIREAVRQAETVPDEEQVYEHTPLPWKYEYGHIASEVSGVIARIDRENPKTVPVERDENAKFLTLAANSYYDLRRAVKLALSAHGRTVGQAWDGAPKEEWEVTAVNALEKSRVREDG